MAGSKVCVLDAEPIIHLDQLDRLDLLTGMGELFVPATVAAEAGKHRPGVMGRLGVESVPDVEQVGERVLAVIADRGLDAGEGTALAWAEAFGVDYFVSDDLQARRAAAALGYRSVGSLGAIQMAVAEGRLTNAEGVALLQSIPDRSTLYVTAELLARAIADLR